MNVNEPASDTAMTPETTGPAWDYLIVTASNEAQGGAYEKQLSRRQSLGLLPQFRQVMVVTDPDGRRIGSGGSTLLCIMKVLNREQETLPFPLATPDLLESTLRRLRVLIIHAGGDSRRLPAYGPCGKIFIPVPGKSVSGLAPTLFDRLLPAFLHLPAPRAGAGQILVASGDVLLQFDPRLVRLDFPGLTALACHDTPAHSSKHGVFVPEGNRVRYYLQKPSPETQRQTGALNADGLSALDIGVMSFDAVSVLRLFRAFDVGVDAGGRLGWAPETRALILSRGMDLYREVCCALGSEATRDHYIRSSRESGSTWDEGILGRAYQALNPMPFHVQMVPSCRFMHFGTTRQLITSGLELVSQDLGAPPPTTCLTLNNIASGQADILGSNAWIEGCVLASPVHLGGMNVVVGADINSPLTLPEGACLDIVPGYDRGGAPVNFIRCYGVGDTFKESVAKGGTLCGVPLLAWLEAAGLRPEEVWEPGEPVMGCSLWEARVFPALPRTGNFADWLWLFEVGRATDRQKQAFRKVDRYNSAEIALMTDQNAFHARRGSSSV